MAEQLKRVGPESAAFYWGLKQRNIFLEESQDSDPYTESTDPIKLLPTPDIIGPETKEEKELHRQLWIRDQAKCNAGPNEALFQRTMMMSLIARHCFIYTKNASDQRCIDFSVEETWTCPPMPTRAYEDKESFLTQPKPDLAVYFRRPALIPEALWLKMPSATRRLACCENAGGIGENRVFHFLTIEAKKGGTPIEDDVGKLQSLNNASQALHNMYEFFHDAGPQHEDNFFTKVRFFSVVASTEGLIIRIHRATREPADGSGLGFIKPRYPLRFEYRVFSEIHKRINFERETVFKTFQKILLGYGEKELHGLLSGAAKAIMARLHNDPQGRLARANFGFYLYGQIAPRSRNQTPAARSESIVSVDMLRNDLSGTVTPGATSKSPTPKRVSELGGSGGKRKRGQSDDSQPSRRTRLRT
ncbi:MAG: hypothetical protein LQ347_003267 [Umbilicaria vellea]|nr:MAG: hypothetical protein LQ347_003267 [Umbilicaria vellea]